MKIASSPPLVTFCAPSALDSQMEVSTLQGSPPVPISPGVHPHNAQHGYPPTVPQVISQVLAQSVALDYYSSHVERMLGQFTQINKEMKETLNLKKINAQELLRLVAENNVIMTDIITKLGVNERWAGVLRVE